MQRNLKKIKEMTPIWISLVLLSMIGGGAAADIGVCYGLLGDNLPPPVEVVALYKQKGITSMRLFSPDPAVLDALVDSGITVILGTFNADIPLIASSQAAAQEWLNANLGRYLNRVNIKYISIGNEVFPGGDAAPIPPAIRNLQAVLNAANLNIKVSTALPMNLLGVSDPPSASVFLPEYDGVMRDILAALTESGSSIIINVYPYFPYSIFPDIIDINFALFQSTGPVVQDGPLSYWNLFDAMVDAFIWAMEKAGGGSVGVIIGETGWPSGGGKSFHTPDIAGTYNRNFLRHIKANGTPKRPNGLIDSYFFAMFNENQKPGGEVERNWGLFFPNKEPVYPLF